MNLIDLIHLINLKIFQKILKINDSFNFEIS